MFDVVVKGGTIVDGTGRGRFAGDLAIKGERIELVQTLGPVEALRTIDARGKIVAPGFIDTHTHMDGWLLRSPHLEFRTIQGITTEFITLDGIGYAPVLPSNAEDWLIYLRALNGLRVDEYLGWETLEDYLELFDQKIAQNVVAHVPYANVRVNAMGWRRGAPDDFQMREIVRQIRIGMETGAVGVSTGLDYIAQNFASTEELVEALRGSRGGVYVTHVRYKKGVLAGVQEAVEIGKQAGVGVHISHLKGGTREEVDQILQYIDRVARNEVEFSFDVYPYQPGSTMLHYLLPYEIWEEGPIAAYLKLKDPVIRERLAKGIEAYKIGLEGLRIAWIPGKDNARWQGKTLAEYVLESGVPPALAVSQFLLEEKLAVLQVIVEGDDQLVLPMLAHDLYHFGSDGIYFPDGHVHPRVHGSVARLLGPCVRDHRLFSLESAVHSLTGKISKRFKLQDRGTLEPGSYADVVLFDETTISDRATYENPHQTSLGVSHVLVNGVPVVENGAPVLGVYPGLSIRSCQ